MIGINYAVTGFQTPIVKNINTAGAASAESSTGVRAGIVLAPA